MRGVRRADRSGFTILEILIVLAIIGLIVGLGISRLGGMFDGAKISAADLFVKSSMKTPLTTYKIQMGDYPSTADGLQALITAPSQRADRWTGPYIDGTKPPIDPWGEPYQYQYPGTHTKGSYDLWSKGPDKQTGTDDDIGNWDKSTPENK
ncbi:MAG TPA: type II secretion system major pseudopilin GspG [Xanthobacteraceae bacterium]|nr:type II secretion system major pseudopilin GspG [Xanthobacteraceae bacterium]